MWIDVKLNDRVRISTTTIEGNITKVTSEGNITIKTDEGDIYCYPYQCFVIVN